MLSNLAGKAVKELILPTVDYSAAPKKVIMAQEGDINSRYFSAVLYDDNGNIDSSLYLEAELNAAMPDSSLLSSEGQIKGGRIFCKLSGRMLSMPGRLSCDITLYGLDESNQRISLTSQTFYVFVAASQSGNEAIENDDNYNKLLELIKEISDIEIAFASAESELWDRIGAEEDRAQTAEGGLFDLIAAEELRAKSAEAAKVDKVAGKGLSAEDYTTAEKQKLAGVAPNANNYTHPVSHPPSIIDQDASNRFMTDTEKSKLAGIAAGAQVNSVTSVAGKTGAVTLAKGDVGLGNADNTSDANKPVSTAQQTALDNKVDKVVGKGLSAEDYTTMEKQKLAGIAAGANNYTHPTSHPPSIITQDANNRFVSDSEKAAWNNSMPAVPGNAGEILKSNGVGAPTFVPPDNLKLATYKFGSRSLSVPFDPTDAGQSGSVQTFIVPGDGTYTITATGAKGGKGAGADVYGVVPGLGAQITSSFILKKGDVITILVGQQGGSSAYLSTIGTDRTGGGGGGATFVFKNISAITDSRYQYTKSGQAFEALMVAAGGGGTSDCSYSSGAKSSGPNASAGYYTPASYQAPNTNTFTGTSSQSSAAGGSIQQYLSYNGIGCMYNRSESVYGGYGGGGCADDSVCSGGGWYCASSVAYSWSSGTNISIAVTGDGDGACQISGAYQAKYLDEEIFVENAGEYTGTPGGNGGCNCSGDSTGGNGVEYAFIQMAFYSEEFGVNFTLQCELLYPDLWRTIEESGLFEAGFYERLLENNYLVEDESERELFWLLFVLVSGLGGHATVTFIDNGYFMSTPLNCVIGLGKGLAPISYTTRINGEEIELMEYLGDAEHLETYVTPNTGGTMLASVIGLF